MNDDDATVNLLIVAGGRASCPWVTDSQPGAKHLYKVLIMDRFYIMDAKRSKSRLRTKEA